jgi:hypothetical protein
MHRMTLLVVQTEDREMVSKTGAGQVLPRAPLPVIAAFRYRVPRFNGRIDWHFATNH